MSWWTSDRKAYALNYLLNAGLSPYGAAGLVSRWANVEAPNGPASRGGYLNRAWGIAQWLGPRLPPINGNTSFDAQLAYVVGELNGTTPGPPELRAAGLLRNAANIDQGAKAATAYERADGWNAAANTDYYTSRTAAGMPAILALLNQPQSISLNPVIPGAGVFDWFNTDDGGEGEGEGGSEGIAKTVAAASVTGVVVALVATALLVYLIRE